MLSLVMVQLLQRYIIWTKYSRILYPRLVSMLSNQISITIEFNGTYSLRLVQFFETASTLKKAQTEPKRFNFYAATLKKAAFL
jgi:hypothetical protein